MSEIKRPVAHDGIAPYYVIDANDHVICECDVVDLAYQVVAALNAQPDAGDAEALASVVRLLIERGIVPPETMLAVGRDAILQARAEGRGSVENAVADVLDLVSGWCRPELRIEHAAAPTDTAGNPLRIALTGKDVNGEERTIILGDEQAKAFRDMQASAAREAQYRGALEGIAGATGSNRPVAATGLAADMRLVASRALRTVPSPAAERSIATKKVVESAILVEKALADTRGEAACARIVLAVLGMREKVQGLCALDGKDGADR